MQPVLSAAAASLPVLGFRLFGVAILEVLLFASLLITVERRNLCWFLAFLGFLRHKTCSFLLPLEGNRIIGDSFGALRRFIRFLSPPMAGKERIPPFCFGC